MNKRIIISAMLMVILVLGLNISNAFKPKEVNYIDEIRNSESSIELLGDDIHRKANMRVLDVWTELETGIKTEEYIQTGFGASDVLKDYFSNEEVAAIVKEVLMPYQNKVSVGSILPLVYVKKDGTEAIFAYKEADGTNVTKISVLENNEWVQKDVIIEKGQQLKSIN